MEWDDFKRKSKGGLSSAIWKFVKNLKNFPITITDGYLEAISLCSHGYLSIGLASPYHFAQKAPEGVM